MYKRVGCELWTIEEEDYWYLQGYNKLLDNESGFWINQLRWDKSVDLTKEFDVILERKLDFGDWEETQRFLGYFKYVEVDEEWERLNICHKAIFIVCQDNYLDGVEIVKEIEL